MKQNVKISMLNQIYGGLLTKKQNEIIEDYYNNDLSLSEIAENNEITRQAIRDVLKKSEKKLFEYEETLSIMEKNIEQEKKIEKIIKQLEEIQKNSQNKEISKQLSNIQKELKKLI
ncbi:MAG: putative DNA-binding protein [Clostridia bacterium]|nr:putative DNA-binding protein [Clostridia bacterium]